MIYFLRRGIYIIKQKLEEKLKIVKKNKEKESESQQ